MTIEQQIQEDMKSAMKEKNQLRLAAIRAIKAEILLAKTSGKTPELADSDVLKIIQKMVKQRQDSIAIYKEQSREDLVEEESKQLEFIKCYQTDERGRSGSRRKRDCRKNRRNLNQRNGQGYERGKFCFGGKG